MADSSQVEGVCFGFTSRFATRCRTGRECPICPSTATGGVRANVAFETSNVGQMRERVCQRGRVWKGIKEYGGGIISVAIIPALMHRIPSEIRS